MRIIAKIQSVFLKKNKDLPEEVIFESPKLNGGKKYLSIIRRGDSAENYYFYSQRKGKDSIRFILYDKSRPKPFCLLEHFEASRNEILQTAYSGSNDKPLPLIEICREEVNEESEFTLEDTERITLVRPMGLGSQTNEVAYLYLVDVEGLPNTPMVPENEYEENVNHIWMSLEGVKTKGDWASYVIADSTRLIDTDKTQNGQTVASTIEEKLEKLQATRNPSIIASSLPSGMRPTLFTNQSKIHSYISKETMFLLENPFKEILKDPSYFSEKKSGLKAITVWMNPNDYIDIVELNQPDHKKYGADESKLAKLRDTYEKGIKVDMPYLIFGDREKPSKSFSQEGYNRATTAIMVGKKVIPVAIRYRDTDKSIPLFIRKYLRG